MGLTKNQLKEFESLGELQFSVRECAIILKIDYDELKKIILEDSKIKNCYERGRLKASAAVRKAILEQAKQGSSPAQKQMLELILNASKQDIENTPLKALKSTNKKKSVLDDLDF